MYPFRLVDMVGKIMTSPEEELFSLRLMIFFSS